MIFIKRPILVVPFLKRCTYIKNQEYRIKEKNMKNVS